MEIPRTCPCGWKAVGPSDYLDHRCEITKRLHPTEVDRVRAEMRAPEAIAMEHLALAVANLRAAASWLIDGERNMGEIADAIEKAQEVDALMKAVAFNLVGRKRESEKM